MGPYMNLDKLKKLFPIFLFLFAFQSQANSKKEFITSCTYGVLAGTLVGAASLAFTTQPGENLQQVARGASLGLYAGIALGFYVVSLTPGDVDESLELLPPEEGEEEPYYYEDDASIKPKILIPLVSHNGSLEGAYAIWKIHNF
jgi:hypothetical protein